MAAITKIIPRSINTTGDYVVNSINASANVVAVNVKTNSLLHSNGAPYQVSDFTNDSGYLVAANLSSYATQSYVGNAISDLIASAPAALDTLNELANALGNDASFSSSVTNSLANKLNSNAFTYANISGKPTLGNISSLDLDGNASNVLYGNGVFAGTQSTYGDSNVVTLLGSFGSNTLSTSGNITSGNLKANSNVDASNTTTGALQVVGGAGITGNVFIGGILTVTGDFQVGNLNSNGNIINNGFVTFTQPITVTASNAAVSTTTGAIVTSGGIGAAGNIYAGGDLNIAGTANIGNLNANVLNVASITTGTGSGGNISGANWVLANYFSGSGNNLSNIQVANVTGLGNLATVNKDGNASNILYGNGVFASAPVTYNNSNVATFLASFGSNTISTTGNITSGNANLGNSVVANYFTGNGHYLTDILGTQISGEVAYANLANSVAGANVTGQVSNALVAGTVYTNAQPNITSVGNLTVANVTGNLTSGNANLGNLATANYFSGSGNNLSNIQAANISGIVANANVANTAYSVAVANVSGIGNIATLDLDGNASNILYGNGVFASAPVTYGNSNVATYLPTYTGNLSPGNLEVTTHANLGDVANIYISGGTSGQYLKTDGSGNLSWETVTASGGGGNSESTVTAVDNFTGDGVETTFTLSVTPQNINQTFVNYNGALQLRAAYTLSGADITFSEAPANGSLIEVTTTMGVTPTGGSSLTVRNYVANGVQTTYTVTSGVTASSLLVTENGLVQVPTTDYTVSGSTLTFVTAPGNGVKIQIRELGTAVATITPTGSNTQILFNDAGSFGSSSNFTFSKSTNTLSVANLLVTSSVDGNLIPSSNVTYDLGTASNRWRDLYLSGNTIDLAGARIKSDLITGAFTIIPPPTNDVPNPTGIVITGNGIVATIPTTAGNVSSNAIANVVANATTAPQYGTITLAQPGNITTPFTGVARFYPIANLTITNVFASLGTVSSANLGFMLKKNGSNVGTYTVSANSYRMSGTSANIDVSTTDYLTLDVTSGTGATDLKVDLQYKLQ